jgi:hypothetical protein
MKTLWQVEPGQLLLLQKSYILRKTDIVATGEKYSFICLLLDIIVKTVTKIASESENTGNECNPYSSIIK